MQPPSPLRLLALLLLAATLTACATGSAAPPLPPAPQPPAAADCLTQAPKPPAHPQRVKVGRVVDGDTVELADTAKTKVRILGINTPESVDPRRPVQPYGKEASAFTRQLLAGKTVLLQPGRQPHDRYGRLLAWIWLPDGPFVNAYLVQQGYAQVDTFPDNPNHAELLLACQREARAANRGLWALPAYKDGEEAAKMNR